jgi:predicted O-linked N-acetylglucosamine transferase (SPINDLY family)
MAQAGQLARQVLEAAPEEVEALFLLGNVAYTEKQHEEAIKLFSRAVALIPDAAILHNNLGLALKEAGRSGEAIDSFNRAVALVPDSPRYHYNRGAALQELERFEEAADVYRRAVELDSGYADAWKNLGVVNYRLDRSEEAVSCFERGGSLSPEDPDFFTNLGTTLTRLQRYEEAIAAYERLKGLKPDDPDIYAKMGNLFCYVGQADRGIESFRTSISLEADLKTRRAVNSSMLFVLHYSPRLSPKEIAAEHFLWGKTYGDPLTPAHPCFDNDRDTGRPLRIGYVSPDFRIHAVVFFIQPVLAAHDQRRFTVHCYSDVAKPDRVTEQLRAHPVVWRDIAGKSDEEVFDLIRSDRIDILIDLAGHSGGNRLPLFALRPAPLQVNWLGYADTTGIGAMDYRVTDAKADPPGLTEQYHTEELLRLPDTFLCYRPGEDFPPEGPAPFLRTGHVTFGCFSNFAKVNGELLELWAAVLAAVPGSRLLIKSSGLSDVTVQERVIPPFRARGVAAERVEIIGRAKSVVSHLEDYHRVDIALDTFPYAGTTTICEALWMGVPVVTLGGRTHVTRVGVSLLSAVGVPELAAENAEEFVAAAAALAGDRRRLLELRKGLRGMMRNSPLTDNVRFTQNLELAYRNIWSRWCAAAGGNGEP